MSFRFVHAADIHLDSPLRSLALRAPEVAELIGTATRQAFAAIVDLRLAERLDALLLAGAAVLTGQNARGALHVWRRDRRNHASPNSAQTEAAMAGALGVQLAGPAYYFGKLYEKPTIGDALRPVEPEDILRANRMLYAAGTLCMALLACARAALCLPLGL